MKKKKKNNLPILDSDHDFLKAFEKKDEINSDNQENCTSSKKNKTNKHGVQLLDDPSGKKERPDNSIKEDFAELLEDSFKKGKIKTIKKSSPMPIKKRLKRYPPVELELDLHGYTAIGAQVKTQSFVRNCKHQGYFTIRIIVGKGLHSDTGPVLPDVVEDVLRDMKHQNLVLWYKWEKKKKSISGAVIVYLKQFERFD